MRRFAPVLKPLVLIAIWLSVAAVQPSALFVWQAYAPIPTPRLAHAVGDLGGRAHVVGGVSTLATCTGLSRHDVYDSLTDTWSVGAPMQVGRIHAAAAVLDGKLYVTGGAGGCAADQNSVEVYDPTTGTWSFVAPMTVNRYGHGLAALDGRLYAVGGTPTSAVSFSLVASAEVYDPVADTWTPIAPLPHEAAMMAIGAINGRLYVAGGETNAASGVPSADVFEYDPGTDTWAQKTPMPTGLGHVASVVSGGRLVVLGGYNAGWDNRVWEYDPAADVWVQGISLPLGRTDFEVVESGGRLRALGGFDGSLVLSDNLLLEDDQADVVPPSTVHQQFPLPNGNGWNNGDVGFQLNAMDTGSGVDTIAYTLSGAVNTSAQVPGSSAFFSFGAEGTTTVTYRATDHAGNVEPERPPVVVRIDRTPPQITPMAPITVRTSTGGATVHFAPTATDALSGVVSLTTLPPSGSVFPVGFTSVSITARDAADNVSVSFFGVNVEANHAPSFVQPPTPGGGLTVQAGQPVTFTVRAADSDSGDLVSLSVVGGLPMSATFVTPGPGNPVDGVFAWTPGAPDVGNRTFTFRATDSLGTSTTRSISVTVQPPPVVLQSIRVQPAQAQVNVGGQQMFQAFGHFSDGSERVLPSAGQGAVVPGNLPWHVHMTPGLSVQACTADPNQGGLSAQAFSVAANGEVHATWGPGQIVRADGTATPAQVALTITCANGAGAPGTLAAAWTGTRYEGTASFGGSTVTVVITGWSGKAPMPTPRHALAAESANGLVFAFGGASSGQVHGVVEAYDPSTDTWSTRAPMPTPRQGARAVRVGGLIYVVGGALASGVASGVVEAYDPGADAWVTNLAPMPTPRANHAVVAVGAALYAIGGETGAAGGPATAVVERYDTSTNSWAARAPLGSARTLLTAGAVNGGATIVVAGGSASGGVERYDVATDTWTSGPAMLAPGMAGMAGGVASNALFVVGSVVPSGQRLTHMYRPSAQAGGDGWAALAYMPTGRAHLAAAVVGDVLYTVGGLAPGTAVALATLEAFSTPPPGDFQVSQGGAQGGGLPEVSWSSTQPAIATVDANGRATGVAGGVTTIVATAGGISCVATGTCGALTVQQPSTVTFTLAPGSVAFPTVNLTVTSGGQTFTTSLPIGVAHEVSPATYNVTITPPAGHSVTPSQVTLTVAAGASVVVPIRFDRLNAPPVCGGVAGPTSIWPPNHRMVPIAINGLTDPDGDPIATTILSIFQDEPTYGSGDATPVDGTGVGTSQAQVRAERRGGGNGRVYHIRYRATDGRGGSCESEVTVGVAHDARRPAVDDGPRYDSTRKSSGGHGRDRDGRSDDRSDDRDGRSDDRDDDRRGRGDRDDRSDDRDGRSDDRDSRSDDRSGRRR
ncbi:MAG: kelch repeat-containing protein [Vicinamibacterales bacterium]